MIFEPAVALPTIAERCSIYFSLRRPGWRITQINSGLLISAFRAAAGLFFGFNIKVISHMARDFPPDWAIKGAPDAISAGHAATVQSMAELPSEPVDYIMEVHGETREQAELIVKNCLAAGDEGEPQCVRSFASVQ